MKPCCAFYKSPVHSRLHVLSPVAVATSFFSVFRYKLFRSKKMSHAAPLQLSLKGPPVCFATALFILEQEQDKPKWRPIYFPPLSPSTPHNEPSREEEFLNNQSVSVQSVCLMECKQHAHTHAPTHTCTLTHLRGHSDAWRGVTMSNAAKPETDSRGIYQMTGHERWNLVTILIVIGLWGGLPSSYTIKGNILGLLKCITAKALCLHAAETHFSFFTHKMWNVCHYLEKLLLKGNN